jgi:hypothetical protein
MFAYFWQTWDFAQSYKSFHYGLKVVLVARPHFSQRTREMGHPEGSNFLVADQRWMWVSRPNLSIT